MTVPEREATPGEPLPPIADHCYPPNAVTLPRPVTATTGNSSANLYLAVSPTPEPPDLDGVLARPRR